MSCLERLGYGNDFSIINLKALKSSEMGVDISVLSMVNLGARMNPLAIDVLKWARDITFDFI